MCYRQSVVFNDIIFYTKDETGDIQKSGMLVNFNQSEDKEDIKVIKERFLPYENVKGKVGDIFQDIDGKLHLEHIPLRNKGFTFGRFIIIAAAFEWEYKRLYPNGLSKLSGLPKSERETRAQNAVIDAIHKMIEGISSSGKEKKKDITAYNSIRKNILKESLEDKIFKALTKFNDIMEDLGRELYELNNLEYSYAIIAERFSQQRNSFAHGNIEKKFTDGAFTDARFIECLIYSMQLSHYIADRNVIKETIKKLFNI